MKKLLALLLIFTLSCSLLVGCGKKEEKKEEESKAPVEEKEEDKKEEKEEAPETDRSVDWCMNKDDMLTMDPLYLEDGQHYMCVFEGLAREEENRKVIPAAAESWDISDDQMTYTFHMREGATWSNGDPVTAYDFEYSWLRVLNPENGAPYSWLFEFSNIVGAVAAMWEGGSLDDVGIEAVDENTFVVQLSAPTPWFTSLTTFYPFMPVHKDTVEAYEDWSKNPEHFVGNGGFVPTDYKMNDYEVLTKRDDYWDAENIYMDEIRVKYISDVNTAFAAYKNGEIDMREGVPETAFAEMKADRNSGLMTLPQSGTAFLDYNLSVEPLNDIRVRLALSYAFDRTALVAAMGLNNPVTTFVIPSSLQDEAGNNFNEEAAKNFKYPMPVDGSMIEEAQKLLAEAGYPNGEGFPALKLMMNTNDLGASKVPEIIQQMWKENLGITVEIDAQEEKVFRERRTNHDFDITMASWAIDYADPSSAIGIFKSNNSNNFPGFNNPEFDELIDKAMATLGKEHYDYLKEATTILMDECVTTATYHYATNYVINPSLKGWVWRDACMDLSRAYWEE